MQKGDIDTIFSATIRDWIKFKNLKHLRILSLFVIYIWKCEILNFLVKSFPSTYVPRKLYQGTPKKIAGAEGF